MSRDDGFGRATASPELAELLRRSYGIVRPETVCDLGGGYSLNLLLRDGALRGPEWEWALGVIESPEWLEALLPS